MLIQGATEISYFNQGAWFLILFSYRIGTVVWMSVHDSAFNSRNKRATQQQLKKKKRSMSRSRQVQLFKNIFWGISFSHLATLPSSAKGFHLRSSSMAVATQGIASVSQTGRGHKGRSSFFTHLFKWWKKSSLGMSANIPLARVRWHGHS